MRTGRQFHLDDVAWLDAAAGGDDGHDARLAHEAAVRGPIEDRLHEPASEAVDLHARVAQPGDLDARFPAEAQARPARQREKVDPGGGDVLAEVAGPHGEAFPVEFVEEFAMDQVDLPEVGLRGVPAKARQVLDGPAEMRVAGDAEAFDERDAGGAGLAESMGRVRRHRDHPSRHDCPFRAHRSPLRLVLDEAAAIEQEGTWGREKNPMTRMLGWDVGGAHLKAALVEKGEVLKVWREPTPLGRDLRSLEAALARVAEDAGPVARHAVTMTGELSDVFPDRAAGVAALARCMTDRLGREALFYAGEAGFVASPAAAADSVASANWHAAARLVAERIESALFLDMGSTTTDITTVRDGRVDASGFGDARRLACGELVYQGFTRTALMSVAGRVPFEGSSVPVIAEALATMADVRRLLGQIEEEGDDGPQVRSTSLSALARMIGRDAGDAPAAAFEALAGAFAEAQLRRIHDAAMMVLSRTGPDDGAPVVIAGVGRPILRRLATRLDRGVVDFGDLVECRSAIREGVCRVAPASALALLAESHPA